MYIFIVLLLPFIALGFQIVIVKQCNEIERQAKELNDNLKRLSEDMKYREEVLKGALNRKSTDFLIESINKDLNDKNKNNVNS